MEKEYKILKDLIKFNTIKDKENVGIINYIEDYLIKLGFKTEYKGKYLIMSIGKEQKVGFLGHTDTVEYIEGWNTKPLELTKIGNKLYGLGTCDMKGGIAAILEAVSKIDFNKLKYGMKLYFTYDEEIGFGGIYDIVKTKEKFPEFMIFGEPTDNEVLVGSKGILEYNIEFIGKKAHSSNPEKGINANINAIKFLAELTEFYENEIKPFEEEAYEIPYTTMNIGVIKGGTAKNSIPATCNVELDFRIANKSHIELINSKISELSQKFKCNVKIFESVNPFIDKTYIKEKQKTANFLTEASIAECKTRIILGPGPVTPHEVNEHITEESYEKLIEQYKAIIENECKK